MSCESCPCKRTDCPRHGDSAACREHRRTSKRKLLTHCEKLEQKAQRKAERLARKSNQRGEA